MNAALWALMKPTTLNVAVRVASILGKLGGRNRRFLKEPQQLEYKDNPEYGLRLILTFRPTLSFLTPLDKCMVLAKQALLASQTLGDGRCDAILVTVSAPARCQHMSTLSNQAASAVHFRGC
jgi:hypothetical protein